MYKFIFEITTDPLGLLISSIWEYIILLILNEIAFCIAWKASPGGICGSKIHWAVRIPAFIVLWAITYGLISFAILVIDDSKWIPIELKYKTKKCTKNIDDEIFNLKNHGAKDVNSYLYLRDIQRIEKIKSKIDYFEKGYTIFITNELSYMKKPQKKDCIYNQFSLEDCIVKTGMLVWSEKAGAGTKKNCEEPIVLKERYTMNWKDYSKLDETSSGTFKILINEI